MTQVAAELRGPAHRGGPQSSFVKVISVEPRPQGQPGFTCPIAPLSFLSRLVRDFVAQNNTMQIKHVIQTLSQEFALSQHPHSRKGGLIGLAACSIALGKVCFLLRNKYTRNGLHSD